MGIGNCQREGKEFSSESRPSILGMKTVIAEKILATVILKSK